MKKRFYLDKANGRIFGVCSGIARHMGWDPTFVRVGVVLVTLLGAFPWTLVAYGAAALIGKNRPAPGYGDAYGDEAMLEELHDLARRLDDRVCTVERILTADNPGWRAIACDPASTGIEDRTDTNESIRRIK